MQFYADTTDFSGVPDPSMNNTIPAGTNGTTDGDQYVALAQRQSLEPLFAKYNVDVSLCDLAYIGAMPYLLLQWEHRDFSHAGCNPVQTPDLLAESTRLFIWGGSWRLL